MPAETVIALLQLFESNGLDVVVDGGWAVDALLGRQTRAHEDLDIAIDHKDLFLLRRLLEAKGYKDIPRDDTRDCNFVLGNASAGHYVDIHTYRFNDDGQNIYGCEYPIESLTGKGVINHHPVKCITPEWLVKFHLGYEPDENDCNDVRALCDTFGISVPEIYKNA